jgi:hypothetical protein
VLAGLSAEASIFNSTYGMIRNTAADTTTDYWDQWILRTSKFTYRSAALPGDFSIFFRNNTVATRSLTRDLGTPSDATTQWTLNASVNFDGNYPNHGTSGGQYIEVLDDAGLIISRFYPRQVSHPNDYRIYANTLIVAQGTQTSVAFPMELWQPLTISATGSGITFNYAAYAPVTAAVFDAGANWRRPKTLRFAYFCSGVSSGYPRTVALRDATFTRTPGTASAEFTLGATALTGGNGNSVLDRNEHNNLTVSLANQGIANATGITVTLSTATPGITVLQTQSAYTDLTPGVSGSNTVAFEIDSAADIPAGTAVEFTLTITHAGGSTTRTITLSPTTGALGNGRHDSDDDGIADWWTLQYFGHRTAQAGDLSRVLDIPFIDGTPNLLKYALGFGAQTHTMQSRLAHGTTADAGQDYLHLTYTLPDPAPDGLTYSVETSDSLAPLSWSPLGTVEAGNSVSGSLRTITVRSTSPIAPGTKRFMRLNVSKP